jgi:hypothetical protein
VRLLAPLVVGVAAATVAGCAGDGARPAARPLLPDLDQAVPLAVSLSRRGGRELVVFAAAVDNVGEGPLAIEGSRATTRTPEMRTRQLIRLSDGGETSEPLRAVLRYERAETHAHWHLLGFVRYELRSVDGRLLRTARKVGFCLGDRYDSRRSARLDGEPAGPVWKDECGKGRHELVELAQGISIGYGDDYAPYREGQFLDVAGLAAGHYVLVHLVNPDRAVRESDYTNNAASALLRLRRPAGRPPSLDVVARCADAADCAA